MQDHSIRVHKQIIKDSVVMFVRGLNNLHVISNVGFYIDGIGQESYLFILTHMSHCLLVCLPHLKG